MYTDKYIALLEAENAELKKRCLALEKSLKETKKDLLTAIAKWDEAVDKLNNAYTEIYKTKTEAYERVI